MGSGITYSRRYALAAIVGVYQVDDDGNQAQRGFSQTHRDQPTAKPKSQETGEGSKAISQSKQPAPKIVAGNKGEEVDEHVQQASREDTPKTRSTTHVSKVLPTSGVKTSAIGKLKQVEIIEAAKKKKGKDFDQNYFEEWIHSVNGKFIDQLTEPEADDIMKRIQG
jgi:hypothetical protein